MRFRIVGDQGPTYQAVQAEAKKLGLQNVDFIPTLPITQLVGEIAQASICLGGHFGATAKAGRVIAGKSYQFMAMAKPVIVGDTPANQELFRHLDTAYLCPPNHPAALAEAIMLLYNDQGLRRQLAQNAYTLFHTTLSWPMLEPNFLQSIHKTLV